LRARRASRANAASISGGSFKSKRSTYSIFEKTRSYHLIYGSYRHQLLERDSIREEREFRTVRIAEKALPESSRIEHTKFLPFR
jgi:hypothetical protein